MAWSLIFFVEHRGAVRRYSIRLAKYIHRMIPTDGKYWTTDRIMRLIIGVVIAGIIIWLLRYLSDVLLPFFAACLLAYMLQPVVRLNLRLTRTKGRTLASILTVIEVIAVIVGVIYLFMPQVIRELDYLGGIVHKVTTGSESLPPWIASVVDYVKTQCDPMRLRNNLSGDHLSLLIAKGTSLLDQSVSVIIETLAWALTIVYLLFILIDYPQIVKGFKLIVPAKYRPQAVGVARQIQSGMSSYFRGQSFLALCAAVFYCIGFSIIHLPLAIPMGILVGVLYMIPYFQYVTLIPVAIICLICSLGGDVTFIGLFGKSLIVYAISQSICDYILTPRVMGKEMGLNPAVILLSLSVWGSLLGILGMIIALPATAFLFTAYETHISNPGSGKDDGPGV